MIRSACHSILRWIFRALPVLCVLASFASADQLARFVELTPEQARPTPALTLADSFEIPETVSSIEDVLWFDTRSSASDSTSPAGVLLLRLNSLDAATPAVASPVSSPAVGPELRLRREGKRQELRIDFRGAGDWNDTGARLALQGRWRLRSRLALSDGTLTLFLKDFDRNVEFSLGSFRCDRSLLAQRPLSRVAETPADAGFICNITRWEFWHLDSARLIPRPNSSVSSSSVSTFSPECIPVPSGDAAFSRLPSGEALFSLKPAPGVHEDMQFLEAGVFSPVGRSMRMTGNALNGLYYLRLDDGPTPVEHALRVPPGDIEIRIVFRLPAELPHDRQIHLVQFRDPASGVAPVGPAVYLDYGAAPDHSNLVLQVNQGKYLAYPVQALPATWYELLLKVNRSAGTYVASWAPAGQKSQLLNPDNPADFYAGVALPDQAVWQFFSQRTWRAVADGAPASPSAPLIPEPIRLWNTFGPAEKEPLPLVIRAMKPSPGQVRDWSSSELHLSNDGFDTLVKDSPSVTISPETIPAVGPYKLFMLDGTWHFLRQQNYALLAKTDGAIFLYFDDKLLGVLPFPKPEDADKWRDLKIYSWSIPDRARFRLVYLPPEGATQPHCQLAWQWPEMDPQPLPVEVFNGRKLEFPIFGQFYETRDLTAREGKLYGLGYWTGLYVYRVEADRLVLEYFRGGEGRQDAQGRYQNWSTVHFGLWNLTGIAWDESSNGFWLAAPANAAIVLAKPSLEEAYGRTGDFTWRVGCRSLAVTPRRLYIVTPQGALLSSVKFAAVTTTVPIDTIVGPGNILTAVASRGSDIFIATSANSARPLHVFCLDPDTGAVRYAIDFKGKTSIIWSMAAYGDYLYVAGDSVSHFLRVKLPRNEPPTLVGPFLDLDQLVLSAVSSTPGTTASASGDLVSPVIPVPEDFDTLESASWRQTSFDPTHGRIELSVRSAADRFDVRTAPWVPLANQKALRLPLRGFFQFRVSLHTDDPWRPPGLLDLVLGLSHARDYDYTSIFLKIVLPLLALVPLAWIVWRLLGRPALWHRSDHASGTK